MFRRALVLVGSLALSFSAMAQQPFFSPHLSPAVDSAELLGGLPVSGWTQTETIRLNVSPLAFFSAVPTRKTNTAAIDPKDSSNPIAVVKPDPFYYTGEVGFMYGHSSGKFGGDEMMTYMEAGIGNDKFQLSVGASYDEWNGRNSRIRVR